MATVKHFSGTDEVKFNGQIISNAQFARAFPGIKGVKYDGYTKMVGYATVDGQASLPITRVIYRKANPSNHKCDARCRNAKGHNCECSCGGKFHGAGG